jgi:hypothetical protein
MPTLNSVYLFSAAVLVKLLVGEKTNVWLRAAPFVFFFFFLPYSTPHTLASFPFLPGTILLTKKYY